MCWEMEAVHSGHWKIPKPAVLRPIPAAAVLRSIHTAAVLRLTPRCRSAEADPHRFPAVLCSSRCEHPKVRGTCMVWMVHRCAHT